MNGILSKEDVLRSIRRMDPYTFEQFVADVWEKQGFETVVRSASGDRGIDVIAKKGRKKKLIQVKRYGESNKIGSETVRKYATLYQQVEDADEVLIVTSSSFTAEGRQLADDLSVRAINASELFDIVNLYAPDVAVEHLHETPTQGANQQSGSPQRQRASTKQKSRPSRSESPFDNKTEFSKLSHSQGYFDRCPECMTGGIWFGQRQHDETLVLKCDKCQSKWERETNTSGLIFKNEEVEGWKQVSGPHKGQLKSIEEWKER